MGVTAGGLGNPMEVPLAVGAAGDALPVPEIVGLGAGFVTGFAVPGDGDVPDEPAGSGVGTGVGDGVGVGVGAGLERLTQVWSEPP